MAKQWDLGCGRQFLIGPWPAPEGPAKAQSETVFHSPGSIALPYCPAFASEFGMDASNIEFTPLG